VSKPRSTAAAQAEPSNASISVVRVAVVLVLAVAGIAWLGYYLASVVDSGDPAWMADLGDWNFLIGFGAVMTALVLSAHPRSPLGRGRGVVVGMLGSFLLGLVWIIVYYVTGQDLDLPVISDLGNYNLLVGIGFMAVGFVFATRWE
jgi:hypothetical protein